MRALDIRRTMELKPHALQFPAGPALSTVHATLKSPSAAREASLPQILMSGNSAGCAAEKRTDFTARNLANFLWGLAKIEHHPGEQMLTDLATEIAQKIDGANAQNLVSLHASRLPSSSTLP